MQGIAEVPIPCNAAATAMSRTIGQHFVKVYDKLGITLDSSSGDDSSENGASAERNSVLGCCGWLPCMKHKMRRQSDSGSNYDGDPSRWSIYPSLLGECSDEQQ